MTSTCLLDAPLAAFDNVQRSTEAAHGAKIERSCSCADNTLACLWYTRMVFIYIYIYKLLYNMDIWQSSGNSIDTHKALDKTVPSLNPDLSEASHARKNENKHQRHR